MTVDKRPLPTCVTENKVADSASFRDPAFGKITAIHPCALCNSRDAIVIAEKCRGGEILRTVLCLSCGLGRRDPMPNENELHAYYHDGYRVEMGKGRRPSKRQLWRIASGAADRALDILPRLLGSRFTVDAGCGGGGLVYMLDSVGCHARGFDPDSNYIQWAQSILGNKVVSCEIQDMDVEPGTLDMVTLYHVLEHLRDPHPALEACSKWLREDGLCVIELPNIESTVQGPGHQYLKVHLQYFNMQTLEAIASQSGLRMQDAGVFNGGENLRCYFRKDSNAQPLRSCIPGNAERIANIIKLHTPWGHYTSSIPYRRAWGRFSRTVTEATHSLFKSEAEILRVHAARLR
jgi:2-polyprenyl-3-methyl-5-hydroxy-6-metoxy-1,4-benzoquinol methylase